MTYTINDFIKKHDRENTVHTAIANILTANINFDVAIDILAEDLQKHLYEYINTNDDMSIDDGSDIQRHFTNEIKHVLSQYFDSDAIIPNPGLQSYRRFGKCIFVPRWHLSEQTLQTYIDNSIADLPADIYGGSIDFDYVFHIWAEKKIDKDDNEPSDPPIPNDLLALLNWAIENNVAILGLSCSDFYEDWESVQEAAKITGLPLYDISKEDFE